MKLKGITDKGMKRVSRAVKGQDLGEQGEAQAVTGDHINEVLEKQAVTMDHIVDALYMLRESDYDLFSQFGAAKFHAAMNAISELSENPTKIFAELW